MKKLLVCIAIGLIMIAPTTKASGQDPITLIIKEGVKKVILAVDLKIQRLQNQTIWLQNAQKVIENAMSKLKLDEISGCVEKQRALYEDYFEELWKVKELLAHYHRIREITDRQLSIVKEYQRAWKGVRQDESFSPAEVQYIAKIYSGIIDHSLKNLEQVSMIVNSFSTQMTDAKRTEIINTAADAMQQNYDDLKTFNNQVLQLSLQRSKEAHDAATLKKLYDAK